MTISPYVAAWQAASFEGALHQSSPHKRNEAGMPLQPHVAFLDNVCPGLYLCNAVGDQAGCRELPSDLTEYLGQCCTATAGGRGVCEEMRGVSG
jgi:hypothetical protein